MKTKRNGVALWLCISMLLMLLSGIGASLVQTSGNTVTVRDLNFVTTKGFELSAKLLTPKGIKAEDSLPTIVTCHGMFNDKEMQDAFFVELSRRGYVVLTVDMPSHGNSDDTEVIDGCLVGTIEGVHYVSTLPYVDKTKIGITGHSLGALNANIAILEDNASETPLISSVLLNCNDAFYTDDDGNFVNIYGARNAGIIAADYDEFFMSDVDENGAKTATRDYLNYNNAQSFLHFGQDPRGLDHREGNTFYTEDINGVTANRIIYPINMIHPWSHFSYRAVKATIEYFEKTIGAPNPIASTDQVWQWKEFFNLIGLIGFFIFVTNLAIAVSKLEFFHIERDMESKVPEFTGKAASFFGGLAITTVFGTLTYLPIMYGFNSFMKDNSSWRQSTVFGIGMWAMCCGICAILLMAAASKKNSGEAFYTNAKLLGKDLGKTVLAAVIVVAAGFLCVTTVHYLFGTDFRIWVLAVKPFTSKFLLISLLPYMPMFLVYYIANSVSVNVYNNYNTKSNLCILAAANVVPVIIILAVQYIHYLVTGFMVWTDPGSMYIVWLFPMLVFLPLSAVISRKIFEVTRNPYLPGIINGIIVTFVSCSNTLTWAAR
ncbi:alpha/beta hydrolase [Oribacterium sp. C9]|uniref:alpha/beta hydrolase n=1 Tax=Oribacterium sp. C9 TaxID=1943579 RepID=UPI00098F367E|nr:alpha/beta hydrolase [Oribacterium sp. C9]